MGIGRKRALERLYELRPRLEEHLLYLLEKRGDRELHHWQIETRAWLDQMEAMLRHVGKKTAAEWQPLIDHAKSILGDEGHDA
jgi:hypothetical protein